MTILDQIGRIAEVPIEITTELARKTMTVRHILELDEGSVIRLARSAGENMDVFAGGAHLGYGEIVIIEDTIGVRIADFVGEE
jgi:flagellar motor switch protein FliN/FliY